MTDLGNRIAERAADLPPAERRIAEVILADPSAAAFATVAALGRRAGTSGATVAQVSLGARGAGSESSRESRKGPFKADPVESTTMK